MLWPCRGVTLPPPPWPAKAREGKSISISYFRLPSSFLPLPSLIKICCHSASSILCILPLLSTDPSGTHARAKPYRYESTVRGTRPLCRILVTGTDSSVEFDASTSLRQLSIAAITSLETHNLLLFRDLETTSDPPPLSND